MLKKLLCALTLTALPLPLGAAEKEKAAPLTPQEIAEGWISLFDGETGEPRALMNAGGITAVRTAAVSGVATRLLARENARTLAILGTGTQARSHLEAMRAVRPFEHVVVWSASGRSLYGAESAGSAEEAVREADVVCTVTSSAQPVLERREVEFSVAEGLRARQKRDLGTGHRTLAAGPLRP